MDILGYILAHATDINRFADTRGRFAAIRTLREMFDSQGNLSIRDAFTASDSDRLSPQIATNAVTLAQLIGTSK